MIFNHGQLKRLKKTIIFRDMTKLLYQEKDKDCDTNP